MENGKKKVYVFYFPVAITNEKKMNKKKIGAESVGILPNFIVKKKFVLQG